MVVGERSHLTVVEGAYRWKRKGSPLGPFVSQHELLGAFQEPVGSLDSSQPQQEEA